MKHLIFLLSSLFLTFSSHAQPIDTLIFDSDFERKVFLHYADSQKINPMDLFISVGYDRDYTKISGQIDQFKNTLISKVVIHAKTKKQLKEIYKSVHDKFFKKYEADSYFGDIFSSGTYNCVTASALYALILKDFRIDFIIKEKPDHVYLIADPNQNSFLIEPTLPTKGLYLFDEKTKREYLEYLHDNKIISDDEFRQQSFDKLFAKYFLSDKDIDLIQLAGLQYYNKGFFIYTSGNYEGALRYFEKAEILYPSNTIKFMKDNALANVLNGQNSEKKYQGKTLAKYLDANKNNAIAIQSGTDIFKFVSSELVMNHPDMKAYELYFDEFIKWLNDPIEINDIYQTYHSMNAYYYTLAFAYDKALYHLNEAYAVNPENINIKQSIIEILARSFMGETNMEPHIDSINYYCVKYPFVEENKVILEFLTYGYAKVAGTSFQYANGQKGNEYLTKLELFINRHPENRSK